MKKQATLFSEKETPILEELSLSEAENIAHQIKAVVSVHCERLEVAGSIRRKKPLVHDIDFVAVAKNDADWKKNNKTQRSQRIQLPQSNPSHRGRPNLTLKRHTEIRQHPFLA
jgi:DNA polymerase/3'-5' exonuclease PolX